MTAKPKNNTELGRDRARMLLDLNNSVRGGTSDKIFSILEGGEGTLYLRDQIDHFLDKHITNAGIASEREKLTKYRSVKDKIAYTAGVMYNNSVPAPSTGISAIDENLIKGKLDATIKFLEDNLIQNQQFTESWILRHSAYNRFECKLNPQERANLNSVANGIKEICTKNNLDTLADANDFTNESDAQKIVKLIENVGQITARNISIDGDLIKKISALEEKIKPLKELDKRYKHLINMMNMTNEVAKRKYPSMISVGAQERLDTILKERGKKPEEFIIDSESKNEDQFGLLEGQLHTLKKDSKYQELIKKHNITTNQFDERFLVYFTYKNVENAKIKLEGQKVTTFGHRTKDYEQDANKRRGSLRERIFDIANRMTGTDDQKEFPNTPQGNEDYETICSYFNKFQNIFFANERDAYSSEGGESHFMAMRNVLSAMLKRRVPALCNGGHERYGSVPRKMKKWLERFLKGQEEKGIFKMVKKRWHNTDHAGILAMIIMVQNQADQEMFHGKNPFQKKDTRFSKIFRGMGLAEQGREKVAKTISPYTNKLMKIAEVSTKTVGKGIVGGAQAYNNMLKTYKRYKTPLYLLYPATLIAAQGGKAYNGVKKYLGEIQGKQVNYLYESVADTVDGVTKFGSQTIAGGGKAMYRQYKTNQQRGVLDKFFELAAEDDHWKEVLQSSDLANMLSFKHRETYLFDEDGRTQMVDQEKKEKNTPEGSTKDLAEKLEKQIEILIEQAKNDINERKEDQKKANNGTDENEKLNAEIQLSHAKNIQNKTNLLQGDLSRLVPLLKKPMNTAMPPARKHTEIDAIVGNTGALNTTLNDPTNGIIIKLKGNIGAIGAPGSLKDNVKNARENLANHTGAVATHQNTVKGYQDALKQKGANFAAINPLLMTAIATLQQAEKDKTDAEIQYFTQSRELRNAENFLGRLESLDETRKKIAELNTKMNTALTATPPTETKSIAEEILQLSKNLDILLYPEVKETKEAKGKNIKMFSEEELKEELNSRAA